MASLTHPNLDSVFVGKCLDNLLNATSTVGHRRRFTGHNVQLFLVTVSNGVKINLEVIVTCIERINDFGQLCNLLGQFVKCIGRHHHSSRGCRVFYHCTGKSLSEALIFASSNPQYDNRLFIELPVQCMLCTQIGFFLFF